MSGGGGGGKTTTVQKADPWRGLQPYLIGGDANGNSVDGMFQTAYNLSQQPFEYFPGQTYANLNDNQRSGLRNQARTARGSMSDMASDLASSTGMMLNAADINNNPALESQYAALNRQLEDQWGLTKSALSDQAMAAGQFGMDNHAIAQGVARGDLDEAALNAKAGLMANAYTQGLDAQTKAMGLAPSAMQAQLMPGQTLASVGDVRQQQKQLGINEDMARYAYNQQAPWDQVNKLNSILQGGLNFGTSTGSSTGPGGSPIAGAIGGGLGGAGIASALGLSNPWTLGLTAGGAILGGLFS